MKHLPLLLLVCAMYLVVTAIWLFMVGRDLLRRRAMRARRKSWSANK